MNNNSFNWFFTIAILGIVIYLLYRWHFKERKKPVVVSSSLNNVSSVNGSGNLSDEHITGFTKMLGLQC